MDRGKTDGMAEVKSKGTRADTVLKNVVPVRIFQVSAFVLLVGCHSELLAKGFSSTNYPVFILNSVYLYAYVCFFVIAAWVEKYELIDMDESIDDVIIEAMSRSELMCKVSRSPELIQCLVNNNDRARGQSGYSMSLLLAVIGRGVAILGIVVPLVAWGAQKLPLLTNSYILISMVLSGCVFVITSRMLYARLDYKCDAAKIGFGRKRVSVDRLEFCAIREDVLMGREYYVFSIGSDSLRIYDLSFNPSYMLSLLLEGESLRYSE